MKSRVFLTLFTLAVMLPFQNCTSQDVKFKSGDNSGKSNTNNNGNAYYGKPYVNGSDCVGADPAKNRVMYIDAANAFVVKENCVEVNPPRALTSAEFQLDSADPNLLYYSGLTFNAEVPIALKQNTENSRNPANLTVTATYSAATTAGDLSVCFLLYESTGPTVASVADTAGNVYARAIGPVATVGVGAGLQAEVWYAENILAGANPVVTTTFSANVGGRALITCQEFSGVAASGALTGSISNTGLTPGGGSALIGPYTTTVNGELMVAGLWHVHTAPTPGAGYTLISNFSQDIYMYRTAGAPGPYPAIVNNVGDWLGVVVGFRPR